MKNMQSRFKEKKVKQVRNKRPELWSVTCKQKREKKELVLQAQDLHQQLLKFCIGCKKNQAGIKQVTYKQTN